MKTSRLTRRQVLVGGVIGAASIAARRGAHAAGRSSPAGAAGKLRIGGDLPGHRLGLGAVRPTRPRVWGEPEDSAPERPGPRPALEARGRLIPTPQSPGPRGRERAPRRA